MNCAGPRSLDACRWVGWGGRGGVGGHPIRGLGMLLEGKVAVIYGAGGKVGGGVARAFAREGARVFLAGRTLGAARARRGRATRRGRRRDRRGRRARRRRGRPPRRRRGGRRRIDRRLVQLDLARLRAGHAARRDVARGLRGPGCERRPVHLPHRPRHRAAHAFPALRGDPVLRRGGRSAPRRPPREPPGGAPRGHAPAARVRARRVRRARRDPADERDPRDDRRRRRRRDTIAASIERSTLLGRPATLEDVGNVAAFVASDRARTITGASINISAGTFLD